MRHPARLLLLALAAAATTAGAASASAQAVRPSPVLFVRMDELEYAGTTSSHPIGYAGVGWFGGYRDRVWLRVEGEHTISAGGERNAEGQLLLSRLVAPFWEAQAGVRVDRRYGEEGSATRALLVLGLDGLAPYWFELTPAMFVSQAGDLSARLDASYELLFAQRLILEPDARLDLALQDVPEFGVGSGFSHIELGARLRYEFVREVAPYVGWSWARSFGGTADFARLDGRGPSESRLVAGLRVWY